MRWWGANLRGLSRFEPALARGLAQRGPAPLEGVDLLRGPAGAWTARRRGPDGRRVQLHGYNQPQDSAARVLEAALPQSWKGQPAPAQGAFAVLGLGLGWPALAAAARLPPGLSLLLADPDPGLFLLGLARLDLRPLWLRKTLRLAFGQPPPDLMAASARLGVAVSVQDSVLEAFEGGRDWALAWVRGLQAAQAPAPAAGDWSADGLPDWLRLTLDSRLRGELP